MLHPIADKSDATNHHMSQSLQITEDGFLLDIWSTNRQGVRVYPYYVSKRGSSVEGTFDVSISGASDDYRGVTLDRLIDLFAQGAFERGAQLRMSPRGPKKGAGFAPLKGTISPAFLDLVRERQRNPAAIATAVPLSNASSPTMSTTAAQSAPINLILYGPPGTGKTYVLFAKAVAICDAGVIPGDETQLFARYEELRAQKRISFVTFHQSYGYEEFIEGLRPTVSGSGAITYRVEPGAFRRACNDARMRTAVQPLVDGKPIRERTVFKMSLGRSDQEEGERVFREALQSKRLLLGWGKDVDFTDCNTEEAIREHLTKELGNLPKLASHVWNVNYFKHELGVGDIVIVSDGTKAFRAIAEVTGEYEYVEKGPFHQGRPVRWLAVYQSSLPASEICSKNFSMQTLYKLSAATLNFEAIERLLAAEAQNDAPKPHVLIIDEINRANVSKVFGELITLLEADKREGAEHAVTLRLPYSGDEFNVPANLNVLGSMNSADRSIALLDVALRRRFDFEEVMPNPALLAGKTVDGVDLLRLLTAMNERIEALFDRDHLIGHYYLLNVNSLDALVSKFRLKILPLLQEYFYEDWSSIRRVLNDLGRGDFIERFELPVPPGEGDETLLDAAKPCYRVNRAPFPAAAFMRIYQGP